ncbi:unnamed protein product [Dibothriocephalus latus]|uniref:Uncharacterized protein n=1 Tax=Dibothriocephalus latus TaxID=60516 RepID=A0A3P6VFS4_DIBLA|nr:unnamed protein product [Dibothriocephalus latus]
MFTNVRLADPDGYFQAQHLVTNLLLFDTAVIMPDLAGFNDAMGGTSPRMTIGGSGSGKLHPFSSPLTKAENRRSKNHFYVLTNGCEQRLELPTSSTPSYGLRSQI